MVSLGSTRDKKRLLNREVYYRPGRKFMVIHHSRQVKAECRQSADRVQAMGHMFY